MSGGVLSCFVIDHHVLSLCFPLLVLLGSFPLSIPLSPPPSLPLSLSLSIVPFLLPAVSHSPNDLIYSFTPVPYFAL